MDGRVSWAPPEKRGFLPNNCFRLVEDDERLLGDTCLMAFGPTVEAQLNSLLPTGSPISIFLTRAEFDTIGNLGAIGDRYPVTTIHTGGVMNPFDAFDYVAVI